jgi:PAS domain S-box-containing protein
VTLPEIIAHGRTAINGGWPETVQQPARLSCPGAASARAVGSGSALVRQLQSRPSPALPAQRQPAKAGFAEKMVRDSSGRRHVRAALPEMLNTLPSPPLASHHCLVYNAIEGALPPTSIGRSADDAWPPPFWSNAVPEPPTNEDTGSEFRLPDEAVNPQNLLDSILTNVVQTIGGSAGIVRVWDQRHRRPSATSSYGLSDELVKELEPLMDRGLPEFETTIFAPAAGAKTASGEQPSGLWGLEALGLHAQASLRPLHMVSLPLRRGKDLVGMLCLFHPEATPELLADHPGVTDIIINQVDVVIQNTRLLERLWEEKRWLEAVIRNSADGILILDRECRVLGFNQAMTRLTGYRVGEALGKTCQQVMPLISQKGDDYCSLICPLMHSGTSERPPVMEAILTNRDGHSVPVELTYAVIREEDGAPLGGVISARDIRARKEAEELQSTFLSVISHELQTPIAIIKGYADLLSEPDQALPPDTMRQKMATIGAEADRLSKMVENLLYASRIQAGGLKLQLEPVALALMAQHVVQRLGTLSPIHTVRALVPSDLPPVLADYERLEEVLVNLVENAIKYSPKGGQVEITARTTSDEVIVSVTDEGIGVAEKDRDRLFERFSRLDSRLVRQMKGTGLGLFICKSIVEAHGGRIWAEPASGSGSRFSFSLPREQRAQLPALWGARSVGAWQGDSGQRQVKS